MEFFLLIDRHVKIRNGDLYFLLMQSIALARPQVVSMADFKKKNFLSLGEKNQFPKFSENLEKIAQMAKKCINNKHLALLGGRKMGKKMPKWPKSA